MPELDHTRRLLPRHYRIIDLAVRGVNYVDIARELQISERTVRNVIQSPLAQAEIVRQRASSHELSSQVDNINATKSKANSILELAVSRAAETAVGLLDSGNDSIRLKAAESILDRVFGRGREAGAAVINISADNVQLLHLALKESCHDEPPAHRATS